MRTLLLALWFAAVSSAAGTSHAEPMAPAVSVQACPSQRELVEALAAHGILAQPTLGSTSVPDGQRAVDASGAATPNDSVASGQPRGVQVSMSVGNANYAVATQPDATGVTLGLLRDDGTAVLKRHFESQDCGALAAAVAVVVEAYFVDVKGFNGQATRLPQAVPSNEAYAADTNRAPWRDVTRRGAPAETDVTPAVQRSPLGARGLAGLGLVFATPPVNVEPAFELGGGVDVASLPLAIDATLATDLPLTSGSNPKRVSRWSSQGLVRVGTPWRGRSNYRPWLGAGLNLARLRALDVSAPATKITTSALFAAGVEVTWTISKRWFGFFDTSCSLLAARDTYRVEPDGTIGHGPRVFLMSVLGFGWR